MVRKHGDQISALSKYLWPFLQIPLQHALQIPLWQSLQLTPINSHSWLHWSEGSHESPVLWFPQHTLIIQQMSHEEITQEAREASIQITHFWKDNSTPVTQGLVYWKSRWALSSSKSIVQVLCIPMGFCIILRGLFSFVPWSTSSFCICNTVLKNPIKFPPRTNS